MIKVNKVGEHELKVVFPETTSIGKTDISAEELYHALSERLVPTMNNATAGVCVIKG